MTQVVGAVKVLLCFSMCLGTHLSSGLFYIRLGKINFPLALKSYDSALSLVSKARPLWEGEGGGGSLGEEEILGFQALSNLCCKFVPF